MIVEGSELRAPLAVIHHTDKVAQLEVHDTPFYGVFFDTGRAFGYDRVGSKDCFTCVDVHKMPFQQVLDLLRVEMSLYGVAGSDKD